MATEHVKILIDNFSQKLQSQIEEMKTLLQDGNLQEFENQLARHTDVLYNELSQTLLEEVAQAPEMEEKARRIAQKKDLARFAEPR